MWPFSLARWMYVKEKSVCVCMCVCVSLCMCVKQQLSWSWPPLLPPGDTNASTSCSGIRHRCIPGTTGRSIQAGALLRRFVGYLQCAHVLHKRLERHIFIGTVGRSALAEWAAAQEFVQINAGNTSGFGARRRLKVIATKGI